MTEFIEKCSSIELRTKDYPEGLLQEVLYASGIFSREISIDRHGYFPKQLRMHIEIWEGVLK